MTLRLHLSLHRKIRRSIIEEGSRIVLHGANLRQGPFACADTSALWPTGIRKRNREAMNITRLRALMRRHPFTGVFIAGFYLMAHYLWTKRRVPCIVSLL